MDGYSNGFDGTMTKIQLATYADQTSGRIITTRKYTAIFNDIYPDIRGQGYC